MSISSTLRAAGAGSTRGIIPVIAPNQILMLPCRKTALMAQKATGEQRAVVQEQEHPRLSIMNIPAKESMRSRSKRLLRKSRNPKLRPVRILAGGLLVLGGLAGFLPLVGFWMLPLGLAILARDISFARRLLQKLRGLFRWLRHFWRRTNRPPGLRK